MTYPRPHENNIRVICEVKGIVFDLPPETKSVYMKSIFDPPSRVILLTIKNIISTRSPTLQLQAIKDLLSKVEFEEKQLVGEILSIANMQIAQLAMNGGKRLMPLIKRTKDGKIKDYKQPQFYVEPHKWTTRAAACCGKAIGEEPHFVWIKAGKTELFHSNCVIGNDTFMNITKWQKYIANKHQDRLGAK